VLQLVLPAGLLRCCLPRVVGLSRAFHDEECEDLSEVTWSEVAARIGLNVEVRGAVVVVAWMQTDLMCCCAGVVLLSLPWQSTAAVHFEHGNSHCGVLRSGTA
jgi:hypothetical protein